MSGPNYLVEYFVFHLIIRAIIVMIRIMINKSGNPGLPDGPPDIDGTFGYGIQHNTQGRYFVKLF